MTPTPRCYCCGHTIAAPAFHLTEPRRLVVRVFCVECAFAGHIRADRDGCLTLPDPYPHGLRLVRDDD